MSQHGSGGMTASGDGPRSVVVIGAGIAGLCAARRLCRAMPDAPPLLLEAGDAPGGRVRTDLVDGFRLDRGFQVFLDAYPEARAVLDYAALELRPFYPGALVMLGGERHRVADPFRRPLDAAKAFLSPVATLTDKARLAELDLKIRARPLMSVWSLPEETTLDMLRRAGFADTTIDRFFRPFFGGVFFDRSLRTSARMFRFVYRMFATGNTTVPALGMGRIGDQLAAALPSGVLQTRTRVRSIERGPSGGFLVVTEPGGPPIHAQRVVVATDQSVAHELLAPLGVLPRGEPSWRSTATIWYDAPASPTGGEPVLVLDGDGTGPVNHLMTMSDASRDYAPPGRHLVGASVVAEAPLELDDSALLARCGEQMARWFGPPAGGWRAVRIDRIRRALPNQFAPWLEHPQRPVSLGGGLYAAGDWLDNASINGAMESGRRAAAGVLSDLGIDADQAGAARDGGIE